MRGSRSTLRAAALAALMGGCGAGGGGGGEGTAPVVSFVEPRGGASFGEGEPVALRAVAEDADDGPGGLAFAFVSDRDGTLGAGFTDAAGVAALPGVALGPGSHRLIARIADPSGQVGEAEVGVEVVEDAPPGVAWDPPGEGPFPAQDALVLTGSAWDGEDAPGTLRLEVASSGGEALPEVAPDEVGRFQVRAEGLLPGPHVLAVTVIDGVGQAAQATVDVEVIDCPDADGDGVGACAGDCDDGDPAVWPGAPEECDGVDGDCDGAVPPEEEDGDGDGHRGCGDCADGAAWIHPGAAEACDLLDGDCDGELPPEETDADGDAFVPCLGDCDDADPATRPGAEDPPGDGLDQDCDGGDSGWAVGPSVRIAGGVEGARFGAAVAVVDGGGEGAWLVVG
ncbi:putative metal-binding motif-containing protein, partial [Myxococcota bacterium]|nr:putative metal-binding motif-containing protein [Myxococcota bacterium]